MTYENVSKLLHLPDLEDMDYHPGTGCTNPLPGWRTKPPPPRTAWPWCWKRSPRRCGSSAPHLQKLRVRPDTYVETDFIKALKNGYVVGIIQEPSTILQPGVLVGLNSLLEQEGTITLPTGEVIRRHPDAVVVVTTNVGY